MTKSKIFFLLNLFPFLVCGQKISCDPFLNHLLNLALKQDAIYYLENSMEQNHTCLSVDSMHLFLGQLYYESDLEKSMMHYRQVQGENEKLATDQKRGLLVTSFESDSLKLFKNTLNRASGPLWRKECDSSYAYQALSVLQGKGMAQVDDCEDENWEELLRWNAKLHKARSKSGFLAGAYSAILPGLGKVYAGSPKQGIMAFVTATVFGWQAYEGYENGGLNDPRFLVFGSLFTINYIGNIWGSSVAVSVQYNNQYYEAKSAMLAHIKLGLEF